MRSAAWRLLMGGLVLGALSCVVSLEGAPCGGDGNCPSSQHCSREGRCVEGPVPMELACERVVQRVAERGAECNGGEPSAYLLIGGARSLCESLTSSVNAGRLRYDPTALEACTAALGDQPCSQLGTQAPLQVCPALVAQVAVGGSCSNSFDCQGGFCDTSAVCPGQCKPFLTEGSPCEQTPQGCEAGTYCWANRCQRYLGPGEACNLFTPQCSSDLSCRSGTCQPRKTEGRCAWLSSDCAPRYNCTGSSVDERTCEPAKELGAACSPGWGECGPLLWCTGSPPTCQLWPRLREACGLINGELAVCLDGRCESGFCREYLSAGEPCSSSLDCGPQARCAQVGSGQVCQLAYCQ